LKGSLSVRFDSVLGEGERAELSTLLGLSGARLASWNPAEIAGRTYARVEYDHLSPREALAGMPRIARIDDPPLAVLAIEPDDSAAVDRLFIALAGPAGPAGVVDAVRAARALVVEVDVARTPLALIADIVDVEVALGAPGRRIRPLIGLGDEVLARFAGDVLAERLDAACLIETYSEPLVRGGT